MLSGHRERSTRHCLEVATAAAIMILDKQESLRIDCVRYDAGGFSRAVDTTVGWQQKRTALFAVKGTGGRRVRVHHIPGQPENASREGLRYSLASGRYDCLQKSESNHRECTCNSGLPPCLHRVNVGNHSFR